MTPPTSTLGADGRFDPTTMGAEDRWLYDLLAERGAGTGLDLDGIEDFDYAHRSF